MIIYHLIESVVAWLTGVLLAGALGYGCALIGHRWLLISPGRARWVALLPWRTLLVTIVLFLPLIPMAFGLGSTSNVMIAGLMIFLIGLPISATYFLEAWGLSSRRDRLIGSIRCLAVLSVVLMLFGALFTGGSALGMQFIRAFQELNRAALSAAFWGIFCLMLILDLLIGAAQITFLARAEA